MNDLAAIAHVWGIETQYRDAFGRIHVAPSGTVMGLIDAMTAAGMQPRNFVAQSKVAPCVFQGDGQRYWGLAVQLYAIRSRRNWGHGDFTDLALLIDLAAHHHAAAIGLNPLHALFVGQASPYYPSSRYFLNPLYIDVDAVEEFPGIAACGLEKEVEELRSLSLVDYTRVGRVKSVGLREAYARFRSTATSERRADFESYRIEQGHALLRFACFQYLHDRFAPDPWPQWPHPWRDSAAIDFSGLRAANTNACEFHEFVQWTADRQLRLCRNRARARGLAIGLYTDLAVGIDPHGADAWAYQNIILTSFTIGAPADEFNPLGQNWGLASFNPHAVSSNDFAPMRSLLRASMRYAGAVRLDHVLGLQRLFMIPQGLSAPDGTYVRFPFEPLLQVIAEESERFRCVVIGEDLGTVPEGFRADLSRWGLWSCRVMLFERESDGRLRPPQSYPENALAVFNTHDMPTFKNWADHNDLYVRQAIGIDSGETRITRAQSIQTLRNALAEYVQGDQQLDISAIAKFLGATPSRLVMVSLEDVVGASYQINIPGTVDQHPNWRYRLPVSIEKVDAQTSLGRLAHAFRQAGRANVK